MTLTDRRALLRGSAAFAALALAGCSRAAEPAEEAPPAVPPRAAAAPAGPAMVVHRDAGCGCCLAWAEIARKAGYAVEVRESADMAAVKADLGVPVELASCHTAEVDGLVVEGHVPLAALARLRRERPAGILGLAVAGMPRGSPGMEMPDGTVDPYEVIAFDAVGRTLRYA